MFQISLLSNQRKYDTSNSNIPIRFRYGCKKGRVFDAPFKLCAVAAVADNIVPLLRHYSSPCRRTQILPIRISFWEHRFQQMTTDL